MNANELSELLETTKSITEEIKWQRDQDHSLGWEFRVECIVESDKFIVAGSCCRPAGVVSFTILHRTHGRIYGLDLGKEHRNGDGTLVGEKHKHRPQDNDPNFAYEPTDITADAEDLELLWKQFCKEANIVHTEQFFIPDEYEPRRLFND